MSIEDAMAAIEVAVPHPENGLPEDVFLFISRLNPLINVDLLVQDDAGRTLLTWRADRHYGPGWHVPGGIIRYKECAEQRIRITAQQELGAGVEFDPAPLAIVETIGPERERGHFISMLHRCRLQGEPAPGQRADVEFPQPGQWQWHEYCPENLIREQREYARFFAPKPGS